MFVCFIKEESGNPCDHTFVYYAFNNILIETGLPVVTLHGLRHTKAGDFIKSPAQLNHIMNNTLDSLNTFSKQSNLVVIRKIL